MCTSGQLGLPKVLTNKDFVCEDCLISKSKRQHGRRISEDKKLHPMHTMVSDVLGPFTKGFAGVKYLIVFCDLASTYSEGFPLKKKDKVCLNFQRYIERMERLTGKKLLRFRTDGGGEFTSTKFIGWLKDKVIEHQHSMPYEPEQKGAAKRLHHTVGELARMALISSNLPDKFWGYAYLWGYFTHNCLINLLTGDKTPLELMFNKKPLFD
jgi:transposase InsO family protein